MNVYPLEKVVAKASKSKTFRKSYSEELASLKIAQQIREIRQAHRFTQKDVAQRANMPQSVIARIESGEHSVSLGTLHRVARVLNKNVRLV